MNKGIVVQWDINIMMALNSNFKMVVLGDSVMWGQGLFEHQKIHTLVAAELAQYGFIVHNIFQAHSGAIIGEPDVATNMPPIDGEVPVGEPTLFEQLRAALDGKERDESVNLVMISGGANDVDITRILNIREWWLDHYIEDAFCRKLRLLIERVYYCFPNATIIVTGYYKAFSEESERNIILNVLKALGFAVPLLPSSVGELVVEMLGPRLTKALVERIEHFRNYAHDCIRDTLVDFIGMVPEAKERLFFADPNFKNENAVGASEAFLYGIDPDFSPQDPVEIAIRRAKACAEHADRLNSIDKIAGPRASVAHPNPLGARQYADVIIANLRFAMPTMFATQ
jgi:hypothetical protein